VKPKKRASDAAVSAGPPTKSRLLEKSSTSPKNTSLSASVSYDFDEHVTHQPLVSRVSELEVSSELVLYLLICYLYHDSNSSWYFIVVN